MAGGSAARARPAPETRAALAIRVIEAIKVIRAGVAAAGAAVPAAGEADRAYRGSADA